AGLPNGGALPTRTASYLGFVNGDTVASLTSAPSLATVPANSAGGSHAITASGAVDANYSISYVVGTLTIDQAPLTITADNKSMTDRNSVVKVNTDDLGFLNRDTVASRTTAPTLATVPANSPPGGPASTASGSPAAN